MIRRGLLLAFAVTQSTALAEILLDQMDIARRAEFTDLNGNAIGGDNVFGDGAQLGLQVCNDFRTTATGYIVNQVEVANVLLDDATVITDVRISFYESNDDAPAEDPVFSERFSAIRDYSPTEPRGLINTDFEDGYTEFHGVWTTVTGLAIMLEPERSYFLSVQVVVGPDDWAYTLRGDTVLGADSYCRDGPPEEDACGCGYGFTTWRSFGDDVGRPGDAAYRIVATGASPPPPTPGPNRSVQPADVDQTGHAPRPPACTGRRHGREADEFTMDSHR